MLTARQQTIYDFIIDYRRRNGCTPSIPEIQREFGIRSPNGVAGHLLALQSKGLIRRAKRGSRKIDVIDPLDALKSPVCDIPRFDATPAVAPTGCLSIDETTLGFRPARNCFALRLGPETVVADPSSAPVPGKLVVVLTGTEATVRSFDASLDSKRVAGVVRAVIRRVG